MFRLRPESIVVAGVARPAPGTLGRPVARVQAPRRGEAMTQALSVSSEVEVAVDPTTAFRAFTEEMDLWYAGTDQLLERRCARRRDPVRALRRRRAHHRGPRLDRLAGEVPRASTHHPDGNRRRSWRGRASALRRADGDHVRRASTAEHWCGSNTSCRSVDTTRVARLGAAPSRKWFGAWCAQTRSRPTSRSTLPRLSLGISYATGGRRSLARPGVRVRTGR